MSEDDKDDTFIVNGKCPFCNEDDFDLLGLKSHLLNGDCEPFNRLSLITRRIFT